ncbi:MAG TPA: F0F1 ATP synthase subunit epsilon [Phycisphaerae bacterium]|nr:F0F1 ATP synthase subunit epsilon [Phycisphaerae bacterium]
MTDEPTFHLTLVTPSEPVMEAEVTSVILPAVDGMVGVLAGRAPFTAELGDGRLTVRRPGRRYRYFLSGGVADLHDNVLTIVAERCQPAGGK